MKVWSGSKAAGWLVEKTSGFLDTRLSRRSFVSKATLAGTAVAASGCAVITQPGSPFTYITNCGGGSLCRDGYTEFCCVINQGVNACPPGSIASGWWRADYSVFCNGTRYYIDCNDFGGGGPCRCGAGCNTRKVYCNHFRYGQCAQWIPGTGVIACRMVTCVPPFQIPELGCTPSGAVDNATAGHFTDCTPYAPPQLVDAPALPTVGAVVATTPGALLLAVRGSDGAVWQQSFDGSNWAPAWESLGGSASSNVSLVASGAADIHLAVRAADRSVAWQRQTAGVWGGWQSLGGVAASDVVLGFAGAGVDLVTRGTDKQLATKRFEGDSWSAWASLGGLGTSDPVMVSDGTKSVFFVRGYTGNTAEKVRDGGWSGWHDLSGVASSDPGAALTTGARHAFVRGSDYALYASHNQGGGWTHWEQFGTNATSDPVAVAEGDAVSVFVRAIDNTLSHRRWESGSWGPWESLGIVVKSNPAGVADAAGLWVFVQGTDDAVWWLLRTGGVWSAPAPLPGLTIAPVRGTS